MWDQSVPSDNHLWSVELKVTLASGTEVSCCIFLSGEQEARDERLEWKCVSRIRQGPDRYKEHSDADSSAALGYS